MGSATLSSVIFFGSVDSGVTYGHNKLVSSVGRAGQQCSDSRQWQQDETRGVEPSNKAKGMSRPEPLWSSIPEGFVGTRDSPNCLQQPPTAFGPPVCEPELREQLVSLVHDI